MQIIIIIDNCLHQYSIVTYFFFFFFKFKFNDSGINYTHTKT